MGMDKGSANPEDRVQVPDSGEPKRKRLPRPDSPIQRVSLKGYRSGGKGWSLDTWAERLVQTGK
jgi:hypothetical protein